MSETSTYHGDTKKAAWQLVERYAERVMGEPAYWYCVFRRGDEVMEVSVPEEVWRAFDA